MEKRKDAEILDTLVATTLDSVDGYRQSAEQIDDPQLGAFFTRQANERSTVASQLQSQMRAVGGEVRDEGSILGAAHREFLSLKDKVTGSDREAIVNEVERGESYISEKFETALKQDDLSPQTRQVIQNAQSSIEAGCQQARMLSQQVET